MSASPNGLPPLPKPPSAPKTVEVSLTLPGDLLVDLQKAADNEKMDLDTAVAMCVALWRYPSTPPAPKQTRQRRAKP